MSSYSRPIFDSYDDGDNDEDDESPAGAGRGRDAESDDEGEGEGEGEGDPDARDEVEDDDAREALDEAFPIGDGVADVAATVWCPYCGEPTEVAIDPGGGAAQEYVEDCAVCCQPWRVTVVYGADGSASVTAEATDA